MLRPALRASLGLALLGLAVFEVQSHQSTLALLGERRAAVAEKVRQALVSARPGAVRLRQALGPAAALGEVRRWLPAVERHDLELLGPDLGLLLARPEGPRPGHTLSAQQRRALAQGQVVTVGPLASADGPRLLSYVALGDGALLRVSSAVPALGAPAPGLEPGRHVASLAVLLLGLLLVLLPGRGPSPPRRLSDPYEEAMARLRRQGEERSRELERLRELVADREAMARAGELSAGMAHELRNGLGTILGYARLAQQDPAGAAEAAERIRAECAALERVVKRFSEFVKDERLQVAPFDLRRMAQRVVARELSARPGAAVDLVAGPEQPLRGDEDLVERALENLVRNAREAAGPVGQVSVALAREGDEARVSVADDGPGMPAEVRARLRPFFTTKSGGLGLGLPLVAKIATLHGGRLELLDRSPRGLVAALLLRDLDVTKGSGA